MEQAKYYQITFISDSKVKPQTLKSKKKAFSIAISVNIDLLLFTLIGFILNSSLCVDTSI